VGTARAEDSIAFGMSWDHPKKGRLARVVLALLVALSFLPLVRQSPTVGGKLISVIVRELPGAGTAVEQTVDMLGGLVGRHIGIINGFVARLPEGGLAMLRASPGVHSVTPDARVRLSNTETESSTKGTWAPHAVRAGLYWNQGLTGEGVDVALIDSGLVPVEGFTAPGKVVDGADLSFESQSEDRRHLDTFGHGTHMGGIIASARLGAGSEEPTYTPGVAPGARLVSIKVADANGVTDVSQVIAAIDWVVQHRRDNGMDIRILNLSFGTDGVQNYVLDPLTYAAEVAWRSGIVVVVSAGNAGYGSAKLNNPAYDPYVIAVGAMDTNGTGIRTDDSVPSFSSCGNTVRRPDLVAPGKSIISLRDPGSRIDVESPGARVGEKFFKGSGTSQAAAVVSGAVALILDRRPSLTPDQVKFLLMTTATPIPGADENCQGAGTINLRGVYDAPTPLAVQSWTPATGLGSLEAARGSLHVTDGTTELSGEKDIFGSLWVPGTWAAQCLAGTSWTGGTWNGNAWTDSAWTGMSWSGMSWGGMSWGGMSWGGMSWSGMSWGGMSWGGMSWSGMAWGGMSWSGMSWGGMAWGSVGWS
jgi:hypothetical protein